MSVTGLHFIGNLSLIFALLLPLVAAAQDQPRAAAGGARLRPAGSARAPAPQAASVLGFVWAADNTPTPAVQVRLRNILTGSIAATAVADASGRFTFEQVESGNYVIEALDENGRVIAVGSPFTLEPGEVVATFVRMRPPIGFLGTFRTVAASMVSTMAGLGVTAMVPTGAPVSPER